ncbi:hypothetical protein C1646_427112 [Rhizophagus diaphanus]|nr:hypothetical protein C1646_427112 [Rhizophagus diaphanus] [Rhizophagus sp. MUCL 43196]
MSDTTYSYPSTPPPQETPAPPPTPATPLSSTTSVEKFTLTERQGDLFTDAPPTDALAHCVSQDLRMGKEFETSLVELRKLCEQLSVRGLSIPRIGTGLDGLSLSYVKDAIKEAFEGSNVKVTMFYL